MLLLLLFWGEGVGWRQVTDLVLLMKTIPNFKTSSITLP